VKFEKFEKFDQMGDKSVNLHKDSPRRRGHREVRQWRRFRSRDRWHRTQWHCKHEEPKEQQA